MGHSGPVFRSSFTRDGEYVLTASQDGTLRLFSTDTRSCFVVFRTNGFAVLDVAFSPNHHFFATGSADGVARLWMTNRIVPLRLFVGHLAAVAAVVFHPNGHYVATGSADRSVRVWDIHTGACVRVFHGLSPLPRCSSHLFCFPARLPLSHSLAASV
jgi:transcription initiation factor TFIID subunit 5